MARNSGKNTAPTNPCHQCGKATSGSVDGVPECFECYESNSVAHKKSGIKITPASEKATLAASIKQTLDASVPKVEPLAQREPGAMTPGEQIPMYHPPASAPEKDWSWFDSLHSFNSDLCLILEPEGDYGWLALTANPTQPPVLLYRLPLHNRPTGDGVPF